MLDYRMLILDSLYEADIIDDALYEKCQPSYISGLPGNLRSTDPNVLQSRLNAIDEKVDEFNSKIEEALERRNELDKNTKTHEENIKFYNEQINDFLKKEREFEDFNEKMQGEALDSCTDIRDSWNDLKKENDTNIQPSNNLDMLVNLIADPFEFSGVMASYEAQATRQLADNVEEYFSSVSDELSDWQQRGLALADDIRTLADTYDVNNTSNGWSERRDEVSNTEFIPQMQNNIRESEKQIAENNSEDDKISREIERYQTAIDNLDENYTKTENKLNNQ